ncbi:MAG: hypothetical protein JXQ91_02470 [Vannielia sp.]|uniref:DUF6778 family protein n=1 Tax=Rhodobacterales TaxID=204455 RepID=UPI0020948C65|nr:DUF6778 family protein [Oceanicola sp. 502str15]MCO6382209.1 hypothetical protein [Oceanicola sp. 502str15]
MKQLAKTAALAAVVLSVAGCAVNTSVPVATRSAPLGTSQPVAVTQQRAAVAQAYQIHDIDVNVPSSLRVSEANTYFPNADIVWRDDAPGDRHKQVAAIFEEALGRGSVRLTKGKPVDVQIEVMRFHSLTEKTRYTVGGVHSIKFRMTVVDPDTGEELESRVITADLKAYGGSKAVAMEAKGWGQKARITQHLANTFAAELSAHPTAS